MDPSINRRSVAYRGLLASLAVVAVLLFAHGGRDAEAVAVTPAGAPASEEASGNWNFERGDFTGWRTRSRGSGAWHVYADGTKPPDPADSDPNFPFSVPQPPEGRFAAVTDMSAPGSRILYRDVKLDRRVKLRFTLFYDNVGELSSPASLDFELRRPNQQFRVDLMDPAAPADSVAAKHVLARIFRTAPGDRNEIGPRTITFDLSRWAGKKVRIRFAQVDNQGPLRAGVDDVRLQAAGS
ncbi:MAG: hypothetical protein ACR2H2_09660 [Solirubrobacteraceae bacterium]